MYSKLHVLQGTPQMSDADLQSRYNYGTQHSITPSTAMLISGQPFQSAEPNDTDAVTDSLSCLFLPVYMSERTV